MAYEQNLKQVEDLHALLHDHFKRLQELLATELESALNLVAEQQLNLVCEQRSISGSKAACTGGQISPGNASAHSKQTCDTGTISKECEEAVIRIQAAERGRRQRLAMWPIIQELRQRAELQRLERERRDLHYEVAASKIQARYRGGEVRKSVKRLRGSKHRDDQERSSPGTSVMGALASGGEFSGDAVMFIASPVSTGTEDQDLMSQTDSAASICDDDTSEQPDHQPAQQSREMSKLGSIREGGDLNFQVAAIWMTTKSRSDSVRRHKSRRSVASRQSYFSSSTNQSVLESSSSKELAAQHNGSICRRMMVQPNNPQRIAWDFMGLFLILYDVIMIPLQFFDVKEGGFSVAMTWITRMFWTLDIPASFLTGFLYADGIVEMRPSRVAQRYVRSWLPLDCLVVIADWMEVFLDFLSVAGAARAGKTGMKTVRIARMLRVVRLIRLARMPQLFKRTIESVNSEALEIVFEIVKIMFVFVGFAHLIACLWYGIGSQDWADPSWVEYYQLADAELGYKYSTSLHWSLTQFIGSMDVQPRNIMERVYAVLVLIFAFIVSAAFVSSITSMMTRLYIIAGRQVSQLATLRKFLHRKGISRQLALRIQRNARYAVKEVQRNTPEEQIELLAFVSDPLRMELHFELHAPALLQHKFFSRYHEENPKAVQRVCHRAISNKFLSYGDVVFTEGEVPTDAHMFFVVRGVLTYSMEDDAINGPSTYKVQVGTDVCEAVLWVQSWFHHGTLRACGDCRLMALEGKAFQEIATQSESSFQVRHYAVAFIEDLNRPERTNSDIGQEGLAEELINSAYEAKFLDAEEEQARRTLFNKSKGSSKTRSFGNFGTTRSNELQNKHVQIKDALMRGCTALLGSCCFCCRRLRGDSDSKVAQLVESYGVAVVDTDEAGNRGSAIKKYGPDFDETGLSDIGLGSQTCSQALSNAGWDNTSVRSPND